MKVAHGHLLDLLKAGVKRIFLPSIIDMANPNPEVQAGKSAPWSNPCATPPLSHRLRRLRRPSAIPGALFRPGREEAAPGIRDLGKQLGVSNFAVNGPCARLPPPNRLTLRTFAPEARRSGLPAAGRPLMILIGRPYNALDRG